MEELVKYMVTALVSESDKVEITSENESDRVVLIKVSVSPEDMGKVIGRNGKVAQSIRTIVKSVSLKDNKRYIVKIVEK